MRCCSSGLGGTVDALGVAGRGGGFTGVAALVITGAEGGVCLTA